MGWFNFLLPWRPYKTISARVYQQDGEYIIDVKNQTCPGYLLSINRAVDGLPADSRARLVTNYPPCGTDVQAWCKAKNIRFIAMERVEGDTLIRIHKPAQAVTHE